MSAEGAFTCQQTHRELLQLIPLFRHTSHRNSSASLSGHLASSVRTGNACWLLPPRSAGTCGPGVAEGQRFLHIGGVSGIRIVCHSKSHNNCGIKGARTEVTIVPEVGIVVMIVISVAMAQQR